MRRHKQFGKESKVKQLFVRNIILLIALTVFIVSGYKLINWLKDDREAKSLIKEVMADIVITEVTDETNVEIIENEEDEMPSDYFDFRNIPLISVDFSSLLKRNKDTVGWIQVAGTDINYPIVQTSNNDYYLTHAFDKSYNRSGWIFADYRNNMTSLGKNTIIYGHNMHNNLMFGTLPRTLKSNWHNNANNHIVKMSTPTENTIWQVFSVYETLDNNSYPLTTYFTSHEVLNAFLDNLKSESVYDFNVNVSHNDRILTLYTCSTTKGKRVVLHAKLAKIENR